MIYRAEKKMISVTGRASLGWHLGRGYVQETMTVKAEKWCVVFDGDPKPVCTCQGKKQAENIAEAMNFFY